MTKYEADMKYREYIEEHRKNVSKAYTNMLMIVEIRDYIVQLLNSESSNIDEVSHNISIHDQSKYSDEEFEGYRKEYFPINDEEKESNKFNQEKAWKHHKDNNLHHWDYWAERHIEGAMPLKYLIEMICDHIAMSMKFGGTSLEWFQQQDDISMGVRQRGIYLKLTEMYYKYYDGKGNRLPRV